MSKANYLKFLENFFALAHLNAKKSTQMAFINADWRDFQNTPAKNETRVNSILIDDYLRIINKSGWEHTHIIQAPPFLPNAFRPMLYRRCRRRAYWV